MLTASESGRRILIVEDNSIIALNLEDALKAWGYLPVGPAADCAGAINLLNAQRVDAAILDIFLRGEAVWPVARELVLRGIPFVFLTGADDPAVDHAEYAGHPTLSKPCGEDAMLSALSRLWKEDARVCM